MKVVPEGAVAMRAPCRKCLPCRLARRRVWIARGINELRAAQSHGAKMWHNTLTYRKAPTDNAQVVADTQKYFKRLRKNNPGKYLRYVCVTEQGERFGRYHGHAVIFTDIDREILRKTWVEGFTKIRHVKPVWEGDRLDEDTFRAIAYVAGYSTGDIEFPIRASLRYGKMKQSAPPQAARTAGARAQHLVLGRHRPSHSASNRDLTGQSERQ